MAEFLVTGATGTTGSVVAEFFMSRKIDYRVLVREPEKLAPHIAKRADIAQGAFEDAAAMDRALAGVSGVFLVSPAGADKEKLEKGVIDRCRAAGVERVVRISAFKASADSEVSLEKKHAAIDQYLMDSGLSYTILRPHSFMQNLLGSAGTVIEQGQLYSPLAEGEIPMIDARDIGEVAGLVLADEGYQNQLLDLTGPQAISYYDVAASLSKQLGRDISYVPVPGEAAKEGMLQAGFPQWLAEDLVKMTQEWKELKSTPPTDAVKEVLGRSPRTIGEFFSDYLKFFQGEAD